MLLEIVHFLFFIISDVRLKFVVCFECYKIVYECRKELIKVSECLIKKRGDKIARFWIASNQGVLHSAHYRTRVFVLKVSVQLIKF
jgi:hypothetical protein